MEVFSAFSYLSIPVIAIKIILLMSNTPKTEVNSVFTSDVSLHRSIGMSHRGWEGDGGAEGEGGQRVKSLCVL